MTPVTRMVHPSMVGRVAHLRRYREIAAVLVTYGLADVARALHLTPYIAARRRFSGRGAPIPERTRAQRFRLACEALGPTFIKFGQALSTHGDVLPPDVVAELALLQDAVPPLASGVAERAVEEALGEPLSRLFAEFTTQPLAAASIAQVHRATLPTGESVAVKVRRPGIDALIEADLAILGDLAAFADRHVHDAKLYSLPKLVDEFARTIRREQDLAREGRIIERVAANFAGDATVRVPRIHWPLTRPSVLTMEFLQGVKVSAVGTPAAPGSDPGIVAQRGADAVLKQILVHGLFHADPHPGNILVLPGNVVAFVDFGIVGRVSSRLREQLAETILAIAGRDADRLADLVAEIATAQEPLDLQELARDLEEMLDAYGDVEIGNLSLGAVFTSIAATISRHRLSLPADMLLLIKSVVTIESVGRQLDPSFKMVQNAAPLAARLVVEKRGGRALAHRAAHAGRDAARVLRHLPADLGAIARRARAEGFQIQFAHQNLDHFIDEMDRSSNRLSFAVVIAAIVVGSALVIRVGAGPPVFGYSSLGVAGFLAAGILGIGLALGILRSGRL